MKEGNCILRSTASLPMGISMDIDQFIMIPISFRQSGAGIILIKHQGLEGLFMKNPPRYLNIRQSWNNITFGLILKGLITWSHRAIMSLEFGILNPRDQLRTKLGEKSSLRAEIGTIEEGTWSDSPRI